MLTEEPDEGANVVSLFAAGERQQPTPSESLRLLRAFINIDDPAQRLDLIERAERLASLSGVCP